VVFVKTALDTLRKLVFLHQVGSAGHVVHSGASGPPNIDALFFLIGWPDAVSIKSVPASIRQTCVIAPGGICGSYSAF
jgi:hypothetical protein